MARTFGWDYPPGVTGNEPEISGEWPCAGCGFSFDPDELNEDDLCSTCQQHEYEADDEEA